MAVRSDRAAVRYQADRAADAVAAAAAAAAAVTAHSAAVGAAERDGIDIIDGNQRHGSAIYGGYFGRASGAVAAIDAAAAHGPGDEIGLGDADRRPATSSFGPSGAAGGIGDYASGANGNRKDIGVGREGSGSVEHGGRR